MTTHTLSRRLPRYRRDKSQVAIALTPRDHHILHLVESMRLADSAHILHLTQGSKQGILRRLQKLYHAGYLDRLQPARTNGGGSQKMVYAVTNKGVRALQKEGLIKDPQKTDRNHNNRSLHDFSIHHTLLVTHIRTLLTLACQRHPDLTLAFWKEGRGVHDTIEVALPRGYAPVPVAPDAFFALQDAKGRAHFMLEADRGTMTVGRFTRKLKAYAAYWRERRHEDTFKIRYFRVLTVTSGTIRKAHLVEAAEKEEDVRRVARLFLFTEEATLTLEDPSSVFNTIWTIPTLPGRHALLGGDPSGKNPKEEHPMPKTPHPNQGGTHGP